MALCPGLHQEQCETREAVLGICGCDVPFILFWQSVNCCHSLKKHIHSGCFFASIFLLKLKLFKEITQVPQGSFKIFYFLGRISAQMSIQSCVWERWDRTGQDRIGQDILPEMPYVDYIRHRRLHFGYCIQSPMQDLSPNVHSAISTGQDRTGQDRTGRLA